MALTPGVLPKDSVAGLVDSNFRDESTPNHVAAFLTQTAGILEKAPGLQVSSHTKLTPTNTDSYCGIAITPTGTVAGETFLELDCFGGNAGNLEFCAFRGTPAALLPITHPGAIGQIWFIGYDGVRPNNCALIQGFTAENFTPTAHGATLAIQTVSIGTVQILPRIFIDGDGDTNIQWGNLIVESHPPASASAPGKAGTVTFDADFVYVCTAPSTWKRAALTTW